MGVDRGLFKLNIFLRQPCGRSSYNVSPVVDDETLEIMYDVWNEIVPYIAELYIEKEEIFQNPRVTGTFISPNTNCGPMMSLVHACIDPTRFRPNFSTSVPETASVSQLAKGDCVRDSLEPRLPSGLRTDVESVQGLNSIQSFRDRESPEHVGSYGLDFTAGPSHCNSPLADDSEHDVEDVQKSESVDVSGSDSDGEIEQRGVHQDVENHQPFDAFGNLSYAPRGLKFFSNLGNIDDDEHLTDESELERNVIFSEEKNNIRMHMRFESKQQLSRAIRMWSINNNREFRVVESKSNTWVAKCKSAVQRSFTTAADSSEPPCDWCVRAVKKKTHGLWQITKWVNDHNCLGDLISNSNASLTSSVITRHIVHNIEDDPGYKVKSIVSHVKEVLKVDVSYKNAWYGRRKAIELVFGSWDANFADLPRYVDALMKSNQDTVIRWLHRSDSTDHVKTFKYVFWAFGPAIDAFHMCRPVICVDGTHLRGEYKGKLLVAVTQDANNRIIPIAYAIVDEETISNWSWFMEQFRYHVARDRCPICVISDRHNGIIHAMTHFDYWQEPLAFHRYCLRHVRSNLMTHFKGLHLKRLCWAMGRARQLRKWRAFKRELRSTFPGAWTYLSNIEIEKWCLTHDGEHRWGILTTNISESYTNVLREARHLPIRACIDLTFHRTVELFKTRREEARHCRNPFPPKIWRKFKNSDQKAGCHRVVEFDGSSGVYKVVTGRRVDGKGGNTQTVKYFENTCSCGKWQCYRLPCSHVLAVCRHRRDNPGALVDPQFTKRRWAVQYSGKFNPLPHRDTWLQPDWELQADRSKYVARRAGRIRARRIRNEMDERDLEELRRCTNCHQSGHN
nr:uncharacterized protein LOC113694296 [Coffea arabica]